MSSHSTNLWFPCGQPNETNQEEGKVTLANPEEQQKHHKMVTSPNNSNSNNEQKAGNTTSGRSNPLASIQSKWMEFTDSNRLEKLGACRDLEAIARACVEHQQQKQQKQQTRDGASSSPLRIPIAEDCKSGIRMARFYGWLDSHYERVQDAGGGGGGLHVSYEPSSSTPSCSKALHCLWACRAMALGCGSELKEMKDCFQTHYTRETIEKVGRVGYEDHTSLESLPCGALQCALGKCVLSRATELEQRMRERRQGRKQKQKSKPR